MKPSRLGAWVALAIGAVYFIVPLVATAEFSLRMRRGTYSFDAYAVVLGDPAFREALAYSVAMGLVAIALGILILVPTAYWVNLRLQRLRPVVEFITLLPLVIPSIVIVFGYLRLYNSSSVLPLTASVTGTNVLLALGYVALAMPYMYRAIDAGMRAVDLRSLTEAAQSLGASWPAVMFRVVFPNVRVAVLSGAFLTFAIVIGEFVMASLLDRPGFGPYLQRVGANRAYEPAALALVAFAVTWACMGVLQIIGGRSRAAVPAAN